MKIDPEILEAVFTNRGDDLKSLSEKNPLLLVFLRHFGCTFCREALGDIARLRQTIESKGIVPIMVHMATEEAARPFFDKYKISDITHVSDPDLSLYEYFDLFEGKFSQLYGLKVWLRGLKVSIVDGHGGPILKKELGSTVQMPGVFILDKAEVKAEFRHKTAADRPDYLALINEYLSR